MAPPAASGGDPWYAIRVKPNFEKTAAASLRGKGYTEFLPLYRSVRRWSDRNKITELPLFPGYIFARFDAAQRVPILATPGVLNLVGFGKTPVAVDEAELEAIRRVAHEGLTAEPWPFLTEGQRVRVMCGALKGVEGQLLAIRNQSHLVLTVSLLQRAVVVHIDRQNITPIQ